LILIFEFPIQSSGSSFTYHLLLIVVSIKVDWSLFHIESLQHFQFCQWFVKIVGDDPTQG